MITRPAVFLDRDGTLIEEVGYLDRLERMRLFPWSIDAVRLLNRAGFAVVVVSNQAGVARGFFGEPFVREVQDAIDAPVQAAGGRIDGWYYCPHHPDAPVARYRQQCECRKPGTKLFEQACQDLGIDAENSWMIGDQSRDIEMARRASLRSILVQTGAAGRDGQFSASPDHIAQDLAAAAAVILQSKQAKAL